MPDKILKTPRSFEDWDLGKFCKAADGRLSNSECQVQGGTVRETGDRVVVESGNDRVKFDSDDITMLMEADGISLGTSEGSRYGPPDQTSIETGISDKVEFYHPNSEWEKANNGWEVKIHD